MNRKINIIGLTLFFTLTLFSFVFSEESMTITTYYPSPYGSYRQLSATSPDGADLTTPLVTIQNEDVTGGQSHGLLIQAGNNSSDLPLKILNRAGTEFLRVQGDGNVGIGTATPGTYKLYVNGPLAVNSSTADKTGASTWGSLSDVRLKDVTGEFDYGLDKIMQLRPVRYHYKKDNPVGADYRNEYIGFVAQEVQKIIPEAVRESNQSNQRYLVIESDAILWTMLNAIKELKIKNKALETRIKVLESKLKK